MQREKCELLSCAQLFATPWTVTPQAPLSMGFSRQEYWSGLPCPSPGDLPNSGIKRTSLALADDLFTTSATWAPLVAQKVKNLPDNAGEIPGAGRSPAGGNGNPLQYSCLGNPMDRGAWGGYSPWGHKQSDTTEQLHFLPFFFFLNLNLFILIGG